MVKSLWRTVKRGIWLVQGDPNQNPLFQKAVALKLCISDPMLVKPKLVWDTVVFFVVSADFCNFQNIKMKNGILIQQPPWSNG